MWPEKNGQFSASKKQSIMSRRQFTPTFKEEAVKLLLEGTSLKDLSEQLNVGTRLLSEWKRKHLDSLEASAPVGSASPKAMAAELDQLRKELAKQKRMNEILKKTVGYFSNPD